MSANNETLFMIKNEDVITGRAFKKNIEKELSVSEVVITYWHMGLRMLTRSVIFARGNHWLSQWSTTANGSTTAPLVLPRVRPALKQATASGGSNLTFGSRARGDAAVDSDLDILVVLDDVPDALIDRKEKVYDAAWETGLKYRVVISTIVVTHWDITQTAFRSSPLLVSIRKEGVVV